MKTELRLIGKPEKSLRLHTAIVVPLFPMGVARQSSSTVLHFWWIYLPFLVVTGLGGGLVASRCSG